MQILDGWPDGVTCPVCGSAYEPGAACIVTKSNGGLHLTYESYAIHLDCIDAVVVQAIKRNCSEREIHAARVNKVSLQGMKA